ncbi:thermonuclease family protein [Sulfitobacter sp. PS-8MA]|uniref:thermonuclease family protein n=1 Tax=Sulfitobacter sp. PS-8MA TaxID=3237707 RepID=UPI0034C5D76C
MELLILFLILALVVSAFLFWGNERGREKPSSSRLDRTAADWPKTRKAPLKSGKELYTKAGPQRRSAADHSSGEPPRAEGFTQNVAPPALSDPDTDHGNQDAESTPAATFDEQSARQIPACRIISGHARVVDGDTVVIQKTQIRMFGIDAPELDHPYGKKAKWALVSLCKGQNVRAEILEEDDYGRTVAKCFLSDGRDLSAEMVEQGLAIDWPKYSGGAYLQLETKDARKKLWLAAARQKGHMHVWQKFDAQKTSGR